jgi:hypothetical protein
LLLTALYRRIGEHQVRSVEPNQLSELLDQRILGSLKNQRKIINAQGIEWCDHRQSPDNLGSQPERFEVFRLLLSKLSISRHLAIFRQLIEPKTASTDAFGDDVLHTDEGPPQMKRPLVVSGGMRGC